MRERLRRWGSSLARVWGPVDHHPRGAFTSLAAVCVVLLVVVAVVSWNQSRTATRDRELQRREETTFHEAPGQFGGSLDPEGTRHGGPLRITFIGASVTRGWYVTSLDRTYPAVVSHTLATTRHRDVDYHVVALPGAPVQVSLQWEFPADQDLIVIHLISDDFLYRTPFNQYKADYLALLAKVRKTSPKAGFVCLGDWGDPKAVNGDGAKAYSYEAIVEAACHQYDGVYVPLSQDYEVSDAHGPLGHPSIFGPAQNLFHPNDYGDQLIAESVVAGIDGNPPSEAIVNGPAVTMTPVVARPSAGSTPETDHRHASHTSTPLPKVTVSAHPSPTPTG